MTWESNGQDGSDYGVYGQLFNGNGSKIDSEFQANSYTTDSQWYSAVASFGNGNFVVTWISDGQDGSNYGVYGQLFDGNGTKIGSEFRANTYTTNNQWSSAVASLADGNFVVTWDSDGQDGSSYGVYGQIFNDFPVNRTTSTTTSSTTSSVSSSTTSTITSSTTSSVSSSTMSTIGRTRTSVDPSSSTSSSKTTVPSTTRPIITSNSRTTLSATSDPSNRFSWIWFLLGGAGAVACLGLTGYFIFKSRDKKIDGDVLAFELGGKEQTDDSTAETQYQYTPDFVRAAAEEPSYGLTPDFVTAGSEKGTPYGVTPDFVTAGSEKGTPYGVTPDFVTAGDGRH